jgi:hypothetical protein
MSDQEMQFADPDWKPTRPLDKNKAPQEQEVYTPQPINAEAQEQQQWQTAAPHPDYQEGYIGSGAKLPPSGQTGYAGAGSYRDTAPQGISGAPFRQQRARRRGRSPWLRGRSPWLWIIIAIIIIGFMSGGFGSAFRGFGFQNSVTKTQAFIVSNNQPTIIINDASGNIQVHSGSSSGSVNVQTIKQANGFGNPNDEQVTYNKSPDGSSLKIDFTRGSGSVDFNVTVPDNSNVQLQTSSGNIDVEGVSGQMSLTTDSGEIHANNDTVSGNSTLTTRDGTIEMARDTLSGNPTINTSSGEITFGGSIDSTGTYQFKTDRGSIDVTLPENPGFHVDATTNSGSIDSEFPQVQAQDTASGGQAAHSDVGGSAPGAKIILDTNDGSINLHQGSK